MKAVITNIKRFAVHDGDGIRSTVFFKGCPLRCIWCHNPETFSHKPQLAFYAHKCLHCQNCAQHCPCHIVTPQTHFLDREHCTLCGSCAAHCPNDALEYIGNELSVDEVFAAVKQDILFYDNGGGVTLSGGECLLQADFCAALLQKLKRENINTAVDTCGFVPRSALEQVMPYTDTFLYDIKALDEALHIRCTGQSNQLILENLQYLDHCGKRIEIRIPYVPQYNADEIKPIFRFLKQFRNIVKIRVLAYHNYAASKYEALSLPHTLPDVLPTDIEIQHLQAEADAIVASHG